MSIKKLEDFEAKVISKSLCGLYLKKGEKSKLYNLCIKYRIPITYHSLFDDDTHYYLWGISKKSVGLISTVIMNYLSVNNGTIFQTLDELEEYLENNN